MNIEQYSEYDNPLIWPMISILKQQPSGWMIHTLADELKQRGILSQLDENAEKDLFKRNFLLMNALYQLQEMLLPKQWLQAQAMDICLMANTSSHEHQIDNDDPLRSYYLDWQNYDADTDTIQSLLSSFWRRYQSHIGNNPSPSSLQARPEDLALFDLPHDASSAQIRRQWRKLALRWHPDRPNGDAEKFRDICEAWQRLQN
ncbi:molecular chaperone DnaJ [Photobacterium jeanii]|uniref:Molecular chaperone DnaJ n=1 Tax=Photobacterium jeanii TaxID=858640 RepID=A0A178KLB8_9GAMM|nr:DNA-J related domain-containing protein [Photobacterium jeanii]OAN18040.1 molecular chaperone DnaJ [Photobacterium jeanii]PST92289.1 molecular chaperone DnaJ [Photobacterium jeanii]